MAQERTVLVTGGASGIGLATAEAALAEGWRVVVADLPGRNLESARAHLGAAGGSVRFEALDVGDEDAVARAVTACEAEFGPIVGLVNSAGIARDIPALETDADLFRTILNVNVVGSFVVAREVAKAILARGAGGGRPDGAAELGSVVNIASVSGIQGNGGRVAYGASKGAVITMTKVLALEWAAAGIRVNAIAPGPIETAMVREIHTAESRAGWMNAVPQRRYGRPADIAAMAMFLLDGSKSGFITGQTMAVDGGFTTAGVLSGTSADPPG